MVGPVSPKRALKEQAPGIEHRFTAGGLRDTFTDLVPRANVDAVRNELRFLERGTGFEPATFSLGTMGSHQ